MNYLGLDLTKSPLKATAGAVVDESLHLVAWGLMGPDEQILSFVEEHHPQVVAIDAPLSLPLGLCCLEESCPCRPLREGKGRECERQLSRLGISSYYTTKRSIIKEMVYRGLKIAKKLSERRWPFIEVYPYGSKVRLFGKLPPKTTCQGRALLQGHLQRCGIQISFGGEKLLSHDLLDALVATYTGYLYARGETEALGDPQEGLLHLPRLSLVPQACGCYND